MNKPAKVEAATRAISILSVQAFLLGASVMNALLHMSFVTVTCTLAVALMFAHALLEAREQSA